MAAIFAARSGRRVILLERTSDGGRKILISGGGRCNVLPSRLDPERFVTASSPNTMRKMLLSWPLAEQRAFFEDLLAAPLVLEPDTGKLFPASNRARDVRDALLTAVRGAGGEIAFDSLVRDVRPSGDGWIVALQSGEHLHAAAVILATGGLSVPKTGSDGIGLGIARATGHEVHDTFPALTPLTADPPVHAHLAGVSLTVTLRAGRRRNAEQSTGGFLFTHRGYSGPAVLDLSHVAVTSKESAQRRELLVQWCDLDEDGWDREFQARTGPLTVAAVARRRLVARLADTLIEESGVAPNTPLSRLRRDDRRRLATLLAAYPLPWTGDEGYRKAEVTGGGVALSEVNPTTLESRRARGLFLCGEMLDAFGPIGGYNFLWSWATGRAAGLGAAAYTAQAGIG